MTLSRPQSCRDELCDPQLGFVCPPTVSRISHEAPVLSSCSVAVIGVTRHGGLESNRPTDPSERLGSTVPCLHGEWRVRLSVRASVAALGTSGGRGSLAGETPCSHVDANRLLASTSMSRCVHCKSVHQHQSPGSTTSLQTACSSQHVSKTGVKLCSLPPQAA